MRLLLKSHIEKREFHHAYLLCGDGEAGKKALEAAKNGKYLKFLVEDSDRLAKEENDDKSSTYSNQAQAIASIVEKYYNIAPRFNELAQDKDKKYEDTMKRFLGSHQGVFGKFFGKGN